MNPRPKVPTPKAPIATTLRHGESRCQRAAPPSPRSSATRRGVACAAHRRLAGRGRGRRRSRWLRRSSASFIRLYSLLRPWQHESSTCRTSTPARREDAAVAPALAAAGRAGGARARCRLRRHHAPRTGGRSTSGPRRCCAGSGRRCSSSRATTTSRSGRPARFTSTFAEFERQWPETEPVYASAAFHVVGLNSVRPWRHQSGGLRRSQLQWAAERLREAAPGAFRVVALHHHMIGAPWRTRKKPVARAEPRARVARRLRRRADPRRAHHQGAVGERREFEVVSGDVGAVLVSVAPGPRAAAAATARRGARAPRLRGDGGDGAASRRTSGATSDWALTAERLFPRGMRAAREREAARRAARAGPVSGRFWTSCGRRSAAAPPRAAR